MKRAITLCASKLTKIPFYRFSTFKPSKIHLTSNSQKSLGLWKPLRYNFSSNNQQTITMPALSPTMNTGKIVKWTKKVGDKVNAGDLLCEVETDKATVDFETNSEGYLAKIIKQEGQSADVGEEVAIIVENQADIGNVTSSGGKKEVKKEKKQQKNVEEEQKPKKVSNNKNQQKQTEQKQLEQQTNKKVQNKSKSNEDQQSNQRIIASPLAKNVAEQKKVNLQGLKGSGPNGRIIEQDVQDLIKKNDNQEKTKQLAADKQKDQQQSLKKPSKFVAPENPFEEIPLTGMRKTIAARLLQSKTTIPHYYISVDIHMDNLQKLRYDINLNESENGVKISVNDFILKAAGLALRDFPSVNVQWGEKSIRQFKYCDVSMAVSTESGLITPIIYRAETKGLVQIAKESKELAKKARQNKLQPSQFIGGTISVSNAGMYGLNQMVSVINPPQAIILGIAKSEKKVLYDEKAADATKPFKIASVMTVWASVDHRLVDGALAAQYLGRVKKYLQNPVNMIL